MRPNAPHLQILHSVSTYAVRGGDSDLHNKDFGFMGDRTDLRVPAPIYIEDKMWKYVTKKIVQDSVPLEEFYAVPGNARKLYSPSTTTGATTINVPRMLLLAPPFLVYCLEKQRTPFDLHQFITRYATRDGADTNIDDCRLMMDWCLVASHATSAGNTSVLECAVQSAPNDDDAFLRWLRLTDCTLDLNIQPPASAQQPPTRSTSPQAQQPAATENAPRTAHAIPSNPAPDVWTQMAANISSTIAAAAAAIKPARSDHSSATFEDGGQKYDKFQLAIVMGFANAHDLNDIPRIWLSFQQTKNMDSHKDNLKREMLTWARSNIHEMHVNIDRSLLLTTNTVRDIIALKFNHNGMELGVDTAHLGLSILACRPRPPASAAAIRRHEVLAERSRRTLTLEEAERDQAVYESGTALPDDYDELLRCLGTFCGLLHTLFGPRCALYRQCYQIWTTMNSDYVLRRREMFGPLFCRQIVWAIIEESREFFSQRLSPDDFIVDHPEDVKFARSRVIRIDDNVRDGIPIARSSFPPAWIPGATAAQRTTGAGQRNAGI